MRKAKTFLKIPVSFQIDIGRNRQSDGISSMLEQWAPSYAYMSGYGA